MMLTIVILGLAGLVGSGVLLAHKRVLTYLAVAGVLFEAGWLALAWLDRVVIGDLAFVVGPWVLLALALIGFKRWKGNLGDLRGNHWRDLPVLIVMMVVLLAALAITSVNGYGKSGEWMSYGFYNGDTMTLVSLINRSLEENGLVESNLWASNLELEYPTMLHAGLAEFLQAVDATEGWEHLLQTLTLWQVFLTVPMLFILFDVVIPEPKNAWRKWLGLPERWMMYALEGLIVLYVMMLSWDNYVYPQSHFFLTGLFILEAALLVKAFGARGRDQYLWVISALVIGLLLLLSNAVTGTAALALMLVFCGSRLLDKGRVVFERGGFLVGLILLVGVFYLVTPGEAGFGLKAGFAYTAVGDLLKYLPVMILLLVGAWQLLPKHGYLVAAMVVLAVMAFFTFVFSTRNIVVENASRFIYHAVLVGFPFVIVTVVRLYYWLKRELVYTSRPLFERMTTWAIVVLGFGFLMWPALGSVASAHDNLMRKDQHSVALLERLALDWVRENTGPEDVFLANPEAPWNLPYFSGRILLRANYWLSRDDEVLQTVQDIFAGDLNKFELVKDQVDYIYIRRGEIGGWESLGLEQVINNSAVTIYKVR